ncbi:MAG TPA: asparagine synthase (glutamine-hydrolyzing) [Candidatus Limnocylindria bacterium]|nr:asparagine synthase (glutamine-hydrolyzing) [Candidatus Limnocylindria bacterium]
MCGIAGVVEAHPDEAVLRAMSAMLAHRGPDGSGQVILDDCVGLAHRRLAIIDLTEGGAQPMRGPSGAEIVFNGEIYNYLELRHELAGSGVTFETESDTEVLLAAYERWGSGCLSRLNGMFAFAIYDPVRRVLFAARDRFGEKPFYYNVTPRGAFVFASEAKALLAHPDVPRRPDMPSVYAFLRYKRTELEPSTFFEGIRSLPPAHFLTVSSDGGEPSIGRYWSLADEPLDARPPSQLVDEFGGLLGDSIRIRLRSDVPLGSSLSGGLDSSAIVGYIAGACEVEHQHTFSARFPGSPLDEGRYIADVVAMSGARSHEVIPQPTADDLLRTVWHQDQPFLTLSIYAQWSVMRLARETDVTVLLDGQGADEQLAGYRFFLGPHYRSLLLTGRWLRLVREARSYSARNGARRLAGLASFALPDGLSRQVKRFVPKPGIRPSFARQHAGPPPRLEHVYADPLRDALHTSLTQTMLPSLLRHADRNSMAFGREVRLPFLDHRLVEFVFRLPPELKVSGATSKVVLRRAMAPYLPDSVRRRRDKIGYAPPQADWLRGPLRELADDTFASERFADRPWTDVTHAREVWQAFRDGDPAPEAEVARALSLELWARAFLDPSALGR